MSNLEIPPKQRALILQGSVALGAFEAGVFKKLYEMIKDIDPDWETRMFDIVAGTSAGAINAAILTSHVKEKKTWKGSAKKLEEYWREHLSTPTPAAARFGTQWWEEIYQWWGGKYYESWNNGNKIASEEAARRYYSTKYFFAFGVPNVFSPSIPFPQLDYRFFDNNLLFPPTNLWTRYNNSPLRDSLEYNDSHGDKFVNFPLSTSFEAHEPRFLAVSVDIQQGKPITFDSYLRKSILESYDPDTSKYEDKEIKYDMGILKEHIMASASFPLYFDYEEVAGRKLCDGGVLSNTPLRELLQAHRDYWYKVVGKKEENAIVPDLDVYIIDVWPSVEKTIPSDYDGIKERNSDITHSDKTEYDQKIAALVTDYLNLYKKIKEIAESHIKDQNEYKLFRNEIENLLNTNIGSKKRNGAQRTYSDLIEGRFELKKIVTIERKDDIHSVYNKWADYTLETIDKLIKEGEDFENRSVVRKIPSNAEIV
ncbi:MAG TPA: patatin-like phospholipase family protein [Nitrososphaeraceae archaeon]|nr:patatin-like phospholipase family protein [Nitrososphaeraceae archaeon]